jgi:hypothetical protein
MFTFDLLSNQILDAIAILIGQRVQNSGMAILGKKLQLAETIAITEIPPHVRENVQAVPVFRGHWFHQLKSANRYVGYATSTPIGPAETDWMVEGVYKANLSNQIATTIRWIEKNLEGDGLVRLLVEPRHHLHALTISNRNGIQVVVAHFPRQVESIRKRFVYTWPDLFTHLSKQAAVRGVDAGGQRKKRGVKVTSGKGQRSKLRSRSKNR